jgi:hypothetical protein
MNHRAWTSWGFLFLGCLTSIFGIVILTIRILALQRWSTVDGHVVESVVLGPDIDDNFTVHITIRWKFNGADYSKTFNNWGRSTGRSSFDRVVARYPPGSSAPILCNPANPSSAFLEARYTASFLIVPASVILGGIVAMILGYFVKP